MFIYSAYNLRICSNRAFPELTIADEIPEATQAQPDVVISFRQISESEAETADGKSRFLGVINNPKIGRFLIEFGRSIVVEPAPGVEESVIRPCILGPIFAVLLRQRGLLVLHASSIAIHNGAIAFLGQSGWGKSTLANAFYKEGHNLLTDDVMAIATEEDHPITFSGYPYVRLLPDTASFLGYNFESLDLIHDGVPKRNNRISQGFQQTPLLLKKIYVLDNIGHPHHAIEPLQMQEAFVELVRHSRVTNLLTTEDFMGSHLHQCTELIKKVPISRLVRQHSLDALPALMQLVQEDLLKMASLEFSSLETQSVG